MSHPNEALTQKPMIDWEKYPSLVDNLEGIAVGKYTVMVTAEEVWSHDEYEVQSYTMDFTTADGSSWDSDIDSEYFEREHNGSRGPDLLDAKIALEAYGEYEPTTEEWTDWWTRRLVVQLEEQERITAQLAMLGDGIAESRKRLTELAGGLPPVSGDYAAQLASLLGGSPGVGT